MTDTFALPRKVLIFAILLPVAAVVGYLLASPDVASIVLVALILSVLAVPFLLRFHHAVLVLTWNLAFNLFFLPGAPPFWMLASLLSLGVTLMGRILDKNTRLQHVPAVTWSLIFLAAVVIFTMKMTGTLGLRTIGGSSYGGKKYFFILFAIVAYFALSTQKIRPEKTNFYIAAFLLPAATPALANIAYMLGPTAHFLFYLLPPELAMSQAADDLDWDPVGVKFGRLNGFAFASTGALCYMLARYGIRGIFDLSHLWRAAIFVALMALGTLGGFRSILIINGLIFMIQFFLEGLHRTRIFPALLIAGLFTFVGVLVFVDKLPFSVQRTLSVLPINVSPAVRADTAASTNWRLEMWRVLWLEIGEYFWIGKGYTASATDYYLAYESAKRGYGADYEMSKLAGDYHSGHFSIIIPFGIFGMLAIVCFIFAGLHVLFCNYRAGPPRLKLLNTFLLAAFIARVVFFFSVFGAIHSDLIILVGLVGLSISMNGGVMKRNRALPQASSALPEQLRPT
jgi:hypothetical protein